MAETEVNTHSEEGREMREGGREGIREEGKEGETMKILKAEGKKRGRNGETQIKGDRDRRRRRERKLREQE